MAGQLYRRGMEAARRAARNGDDLALVAPPVGRLRDAFMAEYEREVVRLKVKGESDARHANQ